MAFGFADYDVAGAGEQFVMFRGAEDEVGATTVHLVTGWFQELRSLTGSSAP